MMIQNSPLQVEILHTEAQFQGLEEAWNNLAAAQLHTVFLTYDWLRTWWLLFGTGRQLWIWTARVRGQLVGIAPLCLQKRAGGVRRLAWMGTGSLTPNHLDLIANPDHRQDVLRAFARTLEQTRGAWDTLLLDKIPDGSSTLAELDQQLRARGWQPTQEISAHCPYVITESFEALLAIHQNARKNLRQAHKKLERDYPDAALAQVHTPQELEEAMHTLIRLHQARWQKKGYQGAFADPQVIAFHQQFARLALQSGHLRMMTLYAGGELAAVSYGFCTGNCVQFYLSGFDERFSDYSPGILIRSFLLQQGIAEGIHWFDFLEGEEAYKQLWSTEVRENWYLRVYNTNVRGRLAKIGDRGKRWMVHFGGRLPEKIRRSFWQTAQRVHIS